MDIVKIPNKILKKELAPATIKDIASGKYNHLIDQMRQAMVAAQGVGLAANQINHDLALFVIDQKLAQEQNVSDAYFNPEITEYSKDSDDLEEGCLSIPEFFVPIKRSKKIMFKAVLPDGKKVKFRVRGFLARVLQHETDHLNGLTIKERHE